MCFEENIPHKRARYYYVTCNKCKYSYKPSWQQEMERMSCRQHRIDSLGNCKDCDNTMKNCYHIHKQSWIEWLFS